MGNNNAATDFLLYSVLGITCADAADKDLLKFAAIQRAYRDAASHVLENNVTGGNEENVRTPGTKVLMEEIDLDNPKFPSEIIGKMKCKINAASYGILQKWVNMTYKYLIIVCELNGDAKTKNALLEKYEIPIDSNILKAVGDNNTKWSKIDEESYKEIKEALEKKVEDCQDDKFLWENKNWIKQAYKENIVIKRFENFEATNEN